jgi:phage head maturation protease
LPWADSDAPGHNAKTKGRPHLQKIWAAAANAALKEYGDDSKAIATANNAVNQATEKDGRTRDVQVLAGHGPPDRATRFVDVAPLSYSSTDRSVEAVLSVGAAVRRPFGMEVLEISPRAIDLKRAQNGGIPLLDSHSVGGIDNILGRVSDVWIDNGQLCGRLRFAETPKGSMAQGMVERGEVKGISIGYRVDEWNITDPDGRAVDPMFVRWDDDSLTYTGQRWELLEASLVSVPADHMAAVRSEARTSTPSGRKNVARQDLPEHQETTMAMPRGEMAPLDDKNEGNENQNLTEHSYTPDHEVNETKFGRQGNGNGKKKDEDDWDKEWGEGKKREEGEDPDELEGKKKRQVPDDDEDEDEGDEPKKKKGRASDKDMELPPIVTSKSGGRAAMVEIAQIGDQFRVLGVQIDIADAIARGLRPDQVRKSALNRLAQRSGNGGPPYTSTSMQVVRDEREGRAESMEVALIRRVLESGGGGASINYEPKNKEHKQFVERYRAQSEQYMGLGMVGIAAECINWKPRHRGGFITAADSFGIIERAFNTTSDFPNIFQNVLNKSLLARYELHMPTYRELSVERPFNDFRPHPQIRAGEFPTLQQVTETGELKYGSTADTGETLSVVPYGVIFSISRTMLVNDDMGAIDQMLGSAGDAVLVFENSTWFTMFLSGTGANGPTLQQDGLQVFNTATHANLAATGAAPAIATIATARQQLRQMKSIQGLYLNVPPRIILTGPIQETNADQMVTNITPTLTTSVNPFSGRLRSVSDANITDDSWYLFGEPTRLPCFAHGFLRGATGPRVRTFEPFGVQGIKVSLEHDFACGAIDFRSVYKSPAF